MLPLLWQLHALGQVVDVKAYAPGQGQDAIGLLDKLDTLMISHPAINKNPQVLFIWAAFQLLVLHGAVVAKVQNPALGLVEPHTTVLGPSFQPVPFHLQSHPVLQHIYTPIQLDHL
ncbi:hypothetical protein WISP_22624 [Willisornis vidua]|uniref:Uncharacterized protein n=1 Tax=Willisornis vidua TaxID=1566151 RepID=A0ABQ9DMS2_9PASS|nr:hypothetical protein WISP_22624 [Willisornis vidua]